MGQIFTLSLKIYVLLKVGGQTFLNGREEGLVAAVPFLISSRGLRLLSGNLKPKEVTSLIAIPFTDMA